MTVKFLTHYVSNRGRTNTMEDVFRAYFGYAGIHDFKFDASYNSNVEDPTFYQGPGATITQPGGTVVVAGANSSVWNVGISDRPLPRSYIIQYDKTQNNQGVLVHAMASDANGLLSPHYIVGFSNGSNPIIYKSFGGTYSIVYQNTNVTVPTTSTIKVAVRELKLSSETNDTWLAISLWVNNRHYLTYTEWTQGLQYPENVYFGFAAFSTNTVTVSNVRIPVMGEQSEWNSIDPGEAPAGGLMRTIEGRYIKHFVRYDGSARAWKPKLSGAAKILTTDDMMDVKPQTDYRQIANHIRMVGAYEQAEWKDPNAKRHRFKEVKNPYLMNVQECYLEAKREVYRQQEMVETIEFTMPLDPTLEREDVLQTPFGNYIITSIEYSFSPGSIMMKITGRKYVYGA